LRTAPREIPSAPGAARASNPKPARLVRVSQVGSLGDINIPELEFWKEHSASFAAAAGHQGTSTRLLSAGAKTEWIETMRVSADFFRTLGVGLAAGREFRPEETRQGGPRAVLLTASNIAGRLRRERGRAGSELHLSF